jgi:hypothetical protein
MSDDSLIKPPSPDLNSRESVARYLDELSEWWNRFVELENERYRAVMGSVLDEYLDSPRAALGGLSSPSPLFRQAATYVLETAFANNDEVASIYQELIKTETDEVVMIRAMGYNAFYYSNSNNAQCCRSFAEIVCTERKSLEIRRFAYWCLILVVRGVHTWRESLPNLRFPRDVNWNFVKRFLSA